MLDIRSKAATIDDCSSLFATIYHCLPLFALFETIWDYLLFAIFRFSRHPSKVTKKHEQKTARVHGSIVPTVNDQLQFAHVQLRSGL